MGVPVKVFVSYSHEDESFRKDLIKYLSTMHRNGEVSTWTDRNISAGDDWRERIEDNLADTKIMILLVSPDFISSRYCVDVEMQRALEMHENKEIVIIPVYVRFTDVCGSPLEKFRALPTDRKPISRWEDRDEAWLDVVNGLRISIQTLPDVPKMTIVPSVELKVSSVTNNWLDDTEVSLVHRLVEKVKLSDIYVPPDFTVLNNDFNSKVRRTVGHQRILDGSKNVVVVGEEQAGKTSLAKCLYREGVAAGLFPVYINGKDVKTVNIAALIEKRLSEQYECGHAGFALAGAKTLIILDDFHLNGLNRKHLDQLINNLKVDYYKLVFFARDTFRYVMPDHGPLEDFEILHMHDFGNVKRMGLIEKWVALGIEESIDERDLYKESDEIALKINAIIRKRLIPSKPIFILSILQMLEAYTPQRLDMTSHGHCYQSLVYQALERINIKSKEIDRYINVLTELAWAQYGNNGLSLASEDLVSFFDGYETQFLSVDRQKVTADLIGCSLLSNQDGRIIFKYPYIYYFFAAKKIADAFRKDGAIKAEITKLLDGLHREDYANIIIFITHHTKEAWILDEIEVSLMSLFSEHRSATLDAQDLSFLEDFLKEIPRLVIEEREVQKERLKHQQNLDYSQESYPVSREHEDHQDSNSLFANINKVFKGSELIGQIVRNRHASLNRDEMTHLLKEAYGCGLRFLQFFIELSDLAKEEVLQTISQQVKDNPLQTNYAIEKEAKSAFLLFTFSAIYAVLRKIASSTGCTEAEEIYHSIEKDMPTPAIKLINQAITLDFHKKIDFKTLGELVDEFKGNAVCDRILKEIVVQHVYMFPVDYKDKQKISSCLTVPMEKLQLQDLNKNAKMLDSKKT
jgi:hypothetical protein